MPRQHCDSTCWHCARHFFSWLRDRNRRPKDGRSGPGDFYVEAIASRRIAELADEAAALEIFERQSSVR